MMYIYTSCAQAHELPWGHWWIGHDQKDSLSVSLTKYTLRLL